MIWQKQRAVELSVIFLIVLGFFVYANSMNGKFVWDDIFLIVNNPSIKNAAGFAKIFTRPVAAGIERTYGFYRPLQMASYAFDYSFWRLNPFGYHLTNVLAHIFVALAIFKLIRLLYGDGLLSLVTAAFFLVHPIQTEVVSYVSGRADSLAMFFMLVSFIGYVQQGRSKSPAGYGLLLCAYGLALLSRENSLILPVLLGLYHYAFKKKLLKREFFSVLGLTAIYIFLRLTVLKSLSPHARFETVIGERLPGFFVAMSQYVRLLLFPFPLHMEYGNRLFGFAEPKALIGLLMTVLLWVFALREREDRRGAFFCIGWFFVALLPVSNLFPVNAYMAEHWLYLPSVGYFLLLAQGLVFLYRTGRLKSYGILGISALLIFYSFLTIRQNAYWRDPVLFYERTLQYAPESPRANNNLGILYKEKGRVREALDLFKKTIKVSPRHASAYNNLGKSYRDLGRAQEAIELYKKAIEINPEFAQAYINLCQAYGDAGQTAQALAACGKAIEIAPDEATAYSNLGAVFYHSGRLEEAAALFKKAIEVNPDEALAYNNLGSLYIVSGQPREAVRLLKKAIRIGGNYAEAYSNLGTAYAVLGQRREAKIFYRKAIEVNADYAQAYGNLSLACFQDKEYGLAAAYYDKASHLGFSNPLLEKALRLYREGR